MNYSVKIQFQDCDLHVVWTLVRDGGNTACQDSFVKRKMLICATNPLNSFWRGRIERTTHTHGHCSEMKRSQLIYALIEDGPLFASSHTFFSRVFLLRFRQLNSQFSWVTRSPGMFVFPFRNCFLFRTVRNCWVDCHGFRNNAIYAKRDTYMWNDIATLRASYYFYAFVASSWMHTLAHAQGILNARSTTWGYMRRSHHSHNCSLFNNKWVYCLPSN